jgi:hypothetical protein
MMRWILFGFLLAAGLSAVATDASAVICAKGVYRAGCVGPRGAVVRRRGVVVRRPAAVVHRRTVIRR